jgi:Ni/Fe-hydrogenase subunit HybB-like protein
MSQRDLHARLVARSVSGRYDLFLGVGAGLTILGALLLLFRLGDGDNARAWHMVQVNWLFFTGLSTGSVAFAASQKITNAKWSGVIIRFAEAAAAFLPISLVTLILIFTAGYEPIYGRMVAQLPSLQPGKAFWLSHSFMFIRLFGGLLLLSWVGWRLIRADLLPDLVAARGSVTGGRRALYERWARGYDEGPLGVAAHEARIHRLAPLYAVLYAIIVTIIAFDGIMALQPHWYSNLLGGFYFMGSFLGAHMLLALTMMFGASHLGVADLVSPKQRHDLGKLCFGFTVFWTYLMWAQYLVIWYGNMPEETGFVFARLWGHWFPVGRAVFLGMFLIPFVGLLGVAPKKTRVTLGFFASVSLAALWLERYLLVLPSVTLAPGPIFGVPELAPTLLFAGLFLLSYALFARRFPMLSPRLATITINRELAHHHAADMYDHEEPPKDWLQDAAVERREHDR